MALSKQKQPTNVNKEDDNCHWNESSFVTCDVIFAENGMFCTPHWNKNSWTKRRKLWRLVFVIITTTVFLPLDMIMKLFSIGCSPYVRLYPLGCAASSLEYYSGVFIQSCFSWLVLSSSMKCARGPQIAGFSVPQGNNTVSCDSQSERDWFCNFKASY